MGDGKADEEFWETVDALEGTDALARYLKPLGRLLAGQTGTELAIASLQALRDVITERHSAGGLLVIEAEAIARTLPLAHRASLSLDCTPPVGDPQFGIDRTVSPVVDNWVEQLARTQSDRDRVKRVSEITVIILDDRYVKAVDTLEPFTADMNGVIAGLVPHRQRKPGRP